MEQLHQGYRGFAMLVSVNWDRLLFVGALALALGLGSWLGGALLQINP